MSSAKTAADPNQEGEMHDDLVLRPGTRDGFLPVLRETATGNDAD